MKKFASFPLCSLGAAVALSLSVSAPRAHALFDQTLFTDNFLTGITPPGGTTDLNDNIGLAGGRQGGILVTDLNPAGFGWSMYGTTSFSAGNGWDLRAQNGFPPSGPIDPYTLRFRNDLPGEWSTVTPDVGFNSFIVDDSYRIEAQLLHVHPDLVGANDRWIGITFGAQPAVRFPNQPGNAGVILFASGAYQIFSDTALIGFGAVPVSANGAYDMDLRIVNNAGSLWINGAEVNTGLSFSTVTPAWIGLIALSGTDPGVSALTQFRFDNFAVSTVPEPTAFALAGLGLALLVVRRLRQS